MVTKVVENVGYTAVGLGVLAVQQLQARRRESRARLQQTLGSLGGAVQGATRPVADRLEHLPRLPGPLGAAVDGGAQRLRRALRG